MGDTVDNVLEVRWELNQLKKFMTPLHFSILHYAYTYKYHYQI